MAKQETTTKLVLDEAELVKGIKDSETSGEFIETKLRTDEKVIARVTDGIYRQPGSALRELISNAYDADATRVIIKTDAPRFDRISIDDDGVGMTPEALAHMLMHIGGSAKRQEIGKELGVTDRSNTLTSPSGKRVLIGKIGIGIFSVAQLTHNFQIVTKTKGDKFRTIATVVLKQYSDETLQAETDKDKKYESGIVNIWREKASDIDSHGTSIILTKIRPQAKNTLQNRDTWDLIAHNLASATTPEEKDSIVIPKYHIGRVDSTGQTLTRFKNATSSLPWDENDNGEEAFRKLVQCVWDETKLANPNPRLEKLFDYYLQMIWTISLSIPLNYVDGHLFDLDLSGSVESFQLSNEVKKGSAQQLTVKTGSTLRTILKLKEGASTDQFDVYIDDLKLSRPIKYRNLPPIANHAIKNPLVFIGKCREEFKNHPVELSGGPLEFEAYLFWTPRVVPTEHRGSLIRIHGASGTLFDPSFMRYQVSEQTRLKQITCEIFIHEGFDSALNIDRESFNYAHPHSVYLTRWLHSALRQLATAQKKVAAGIREVHRDKAKIDSVNSIQAIVSKVWEDETKDPDSSPPTVAIEERKPQKSLNYHADIVLNRSLISPSKDSRQTAKQKGELALLDEKIKAIVQILSSFGLLENLSEPEIDRLTNAIYRILEMSE